MDHPENGHLVKLSFIYQTMALVKVLLGKTYKIQALATSVVIFRKTTELTQYTENFVLLLFPFVHVYIYFNFNFL